MKHPGLKVYFEARVDGKLVVRKRASRSFVAAWLRIQAVHMFAYATAIPNIGGTSTAYSTSTPWTANGPANNSSYGPVCGTSATAVSPADAKLVAQSLQGSGAGQLTHSALSVVTNPTNDSTGTLMTIQRLFTNNSGGTINLNEIGLYANSGANNYCLVRDVLPAQIALLAGQTFTLTYTFRSDI